MIKIIGVFKIRAFADKSPPKKSEPVSPIKTFALCLLNAKNPKSEDAKIAFASSVANPG